MVFTEMFRTVVRVWDRNRRSVWLRVVPIALSLAGTAGLFATTVRGQAREELPQPMYSDPKPAGRDSTRDHQLLVIPLWNRVLQEDNLEYQVLAADSIALAHEYGMPGLESTIPALLECLQSEDMKVQRAAARALCMMDAKDAQPLFEQQLADAPPSIAPWIEEGLLKWRSEKALELWRSRAASSEARETLRQNAFRRLAEWSDAQSIEIIRAAALESKLSLPTRTAAARALGQLTTENEESTAEQLLARGTFGEELLAALVLAKHTSDATKTLLQQLVSKENAAAAGAAAARLFEIDPKLLYDQAFVICERQDRALRQVGVATLLHRAEADDVARLLEMLDDMHPAVRHDARLACEQLTADTRYAQTIPDYVTNALQTRRGPEHWRSLEQCCVYVGRLDHERNTDSLIQLLDEERLEVNCSAAWALRCLAVESTFEPLHQYVSKTLDAQDNRELGGNFPAEKIAHLCQLFGEVRYTAADATLRRLVPKESGYTDITRGAAIWSLGYLHENMPEPELANLLTARMMDATGLPAEFPIVRQMSACALGRMKAVEKVPQLEETAQANGLVNGIGWVAAWALDQIDGRGIGEVPDWVDRETNWFLYPLTEQH